MEAPKCFIRALLIMLALVAMAVPAVAEPKELLVAILEDKAGKASVHYQLSADCMNFLKEFKRRMREGSPVYLTFTSPPPPVTGRVVEVCCIRPDGSIVGGEACALKSRSP